jgi:pimeloyl-ACP methyl ester carboxylesterase
MNHLIKSGWAIVLAVIVNCQNEKPTNHQSKEAMTQFWIKGPAGKIFVDRGGFGGIPVVIVHSLAGNTTQWQAQLAHLRQKRLAVAFDMRGHGKSDPAQNHDYSLTAMAQDVGAVVDSLEIQKFVLIGHSYGGGVIATYAGQHRIMRFTICRTLPCQAAAIGCKWSDRRSSICSWTAF